MTTMSAAKALAALKAGNRRFVAGRSTHFAAEWPGRRAELTSEQHPTAVVIGCADSRVPVELIFDQGVGDLFVIRVAGNIATPTVIGSVEYAIRHLEAHLVVVLGHTSCGAVTAACHTVADDAADSLSPGLRAIVDHIRPAVEATRSAQPDAAPDEWVVSAVKANVHTAVRTLQANSAVMHRYVDQDRARVVGAEYSLETGKVTFFE